MARVATLFVGEFWGGLAAMLVALPSAIAFGVIIFTPLGGTYAAYGAIAGVIGTAAIGLVAPAIGGTNRLISAPCAPAAAVMSAFALELTRQGSDPQAALLLMTLTALICGLLQVGFGGVGLGRLIKYVPYPVVSGYLSGVGLVIIVGQIPRFLGAAKGDPFWHAIGTPTNWSWHSIVIGLATITVMLGAPRVTKAVPAAILGLGAGILAYFALSLADSSLLQLSGNGLVVGPLGTSESGVLASIAGHWMGITKLRLDNVIGLIVPAVTLAILLSIDTLKTCVVLDALTRSRHNSNRELVGQGFGNLVSALFGGVPGAGQMGATLVNMSSGGQTRLSGLIEGALAIVAFLLLANLVSWVPIPALAGILIVVGFRMFDWKSLHLLRSRATIFDFAVILAVIVVAQTVSLIAASATGIGLAILLFVREQTSGVVVSRKTYGNQISSKTVRLADEKAVLERLGEQTVIFELQGSLFFGTADQLYLAIEPETKKRSYVILDMRRVQSVDVTATHVLELLDDMIAQHGGLMIISDLPHSLPIGQDIEQYLEQAGLVTASRKIRVFDELDDALEWVENQLLEREHVAKSEEKPLELAEIELFRGRKNETLAALDALIERRAVKAGERIFSAGDAGDEIFLIRRGTVRIVLPRGPRQGHHLATFGRGNFVGEMAFLDPAPRSADAIADSDCDFFALSRARFDGLALEHKTLAVEFLGGLARALAARLRYADAELRVLAES